MIYESIALGLVVSLLFLEVLGVAAGGLIVPGYMALFMDDPARVAGTLAAALATFATVQTLSHVILLYGRRTLIFCVLAGFLFGHLSRYLIAQSGQIGAGWDIAAFQTIGYIIPGLIAYWMVRQGVIDTVCTMFMAAFIVRLTLVVAQSGGLIELAIE